MLAAGVLKIIKMKQVKTIPKLVFDKNFTDKEFKYYDYACFISILDIDNNEQKFDKSIDNFLQVKCGILKKICLKMAS